MLRLTYINFRVIFLATSLLFLFFYFFLCNQDSTTHIYIYKKLEKLFLPYLHNKFSTMKFIINKRSIELPSNHGGPSLTVPYAQKERFLCLWNQNLPKQMNFIYTKSCKSFSFLCFPSLLVDTYGSLGFSYAWVRTTQAMIRT